MNYIECVRHNIFYTKTLETRTFLDASVSIISKGRKVFLFLSALLGLHCNYLVDNISVRNCQRTTTFLLLNAHASIHMRHAKTYLKWKL
jgi:hypothetical protein